MTLDECVCVFSQTTSGLYLRYSPPNGVKLMSMSKVAFMCAMLINYCGEVWAIKNAVRISHVHVSLLMSIHSSPDQPLLLKSVTMM